jgi:hypothetical protein
MADEQEINVKISLVDEMSNEIKAIRANMETNFTAANKKLQESKGVFSDFGKQIKGDFVNAIKSGIMAYAGFAVIGKVTGFLKDARNEAQENIRLNLQLKTALGYTSDALNEQAEALGKKLIIDGDEVKSVQLKLANYVKEESQIKALTPAIFDLAAATGMDLNSAAMIVAKSIGDDSGELGKFKMQVTGAAGSAERAQSVIKGLSDRFEGQAEAVAKTKDIFDIYTVALNELKEKIWPKLNFVGQVVYRTFSDIGRAIAGTDITKITQETKAYFEELKNGPKEEVKAPKKISFGPTKEQIAEAKKANQELIDQQIEVFSLLQDSTVSMREAGIEKEFAALDLKYSKEQEKYAKNKGALLILDEWYSNEAQRRIDEDNRKTQTEKSKQEKQKAENFKKVVEYDLKTLAEAGQASLDKTVEDNRKRKGLSDQEKSGARNAATDMVSNLEMVASKHREFTGAYKTMAIAKTIFDTYEGAQAAFVSLAKIPVVGVPLGIAAATAATIAGMERVSAIANQKFETGTAYQGGGRALVGERGPEIVNLPRGASVYNNTQTRNMTSNTALNVTIMDSSGNITETIRAQLRSGSGDQLVRDLQNRMARSL